MNPTQLKSAPLRLYNCWCCHSRVGVTVYTANPYHSTAYGLQDLRQFADAHHARHGTQVNQLDHVDGAAQAVPIFAFTVHSSSLTRLLTHAGILLHLPVFSDTAAP